nr:glycosyltransferase family protein [uncultured Bacillus sp.]
MKGNQICFISCVNNEEEYNMALHHINQLNIPEGYEVETVAVRNASSLTSGYNEGMRRTNAKYKVYLHQDVYIINKDFLYDVLGLFVKYPKLGMLGVVGSLTIPNGYWWHSPYVYGTVYHTLTGKGKLGILKHRTVKSGFQQVRAIDGLIMITQYDIPWREDIFKGWHFYDVSQSLEFWKAGFEVGVPKQRQTWCIHDCGITSMKDYEESRELFVLHYRPFVLD